MSNLSRATYRVIHSMRRKAAGEHEIEVEVLLLAFASEWMLRPPELAKLRESVDIAEQDIVSRLGHGL